MDAQGRMPSGIPFIVVNEFAERFCFYGINAILALFLVQYLHFGEAQATTWGSLFKSIASRLRRADTSMRRTRRSRLTRSSVLRISCSS
jgi:hypothetical protein